MHFEMWKMGRSRLTGLLDQFDSGTITYKLHPDSNTTGWLLRHIAEVELLFARNVFGRDVRVKAQTIGPTGSDRGKLTDPESITELLNRAEAELGEVIRSVSDWESEVTTAEFGTITKAEALARIMTHTAYHAGQVALTMKYGSGK